MLPQDRTRKIVESQVESAMKLVLIVVADYMNTADVCWPSVSSIAARSGYCERQAREVIRDAIARGLLVRVDGDHKAPDLRIGWEALAAAQAAPSTRGGKREAKIATPDETTTGKDCHPDRQRLPPRQAKIASETGKDCPRSVQEATIEAITEAITNAPAPAAALTPTPEPTHDDRPADSPTRPDAHRPPDGSGGHAEQGGEAPAPSREPEGDTGAPPGKGGAGLAVKWRTKVPAEMVGAVLRCIEAVKQKPVNPERAGTDAKQLLALWRALGSPPASDFERDFVAVATWARESTHPLAARAIRAEGWADGFDRSRSVDTLTRHAQWSDRLEAARACAAPTAAKPTPAPADLMDNYRRLVGILCQRDDRRLIEGDDERHTLTLRYAVKLCGGRDAFRSDPDAFLARWPEVWAGAEAEVAAKLAAMGQR